MRLIYIIFFSYFFFLFYISVFCSLLLCHHSVVLICGYLLFFSWRCYRSIYRNLLHRCVRVCISSETHRKREREKERAAHKQIIYQICGIQWLYGWTRHLMLSSLWPNGLYAWILWHSYCHFAWPLPANQPFTNAYGFYNIRSRKYTNLDYKQPIYRRRCDRKSTFTNTQLCTIQCLSVSLTRSHCFYWHGFFSLLFVLFSIALGIFRWSLAFYGSLMSSSSFTFFSQLFGVCIDSRKKTISVNDSHQYSRILVMS